MLGPISGRSRRGNETFPLRRAYQEHRGPLMARNERPPLVFPILLITVGAIFLYANYRPGFDPWPVLRTYWPLILILVGLGKIWDSTQRRRQQGSNPNAAPSAG